MFNFLQNLADKLLKSIFELCGTQHWIIEWLVKNPRAVDESWLQIGPKQNK
jgi:hypothetical protein